MKTYLTPILTAIATALIIFFTIDYERQIESLEYIIQQDSCLIDSLRHEIDTLIWEQETWNNDIINNTTHLLSAIMFVESSYNDSAYVASEDAVGCLQIRKCMVKDVNRILRRQKSDLKFTYNDRWSRAKSIKMFDVYCKHYGLTTAEEIARCWNGGPQGMNNEVTAKYWVKVKNKLEI
jgi:hypothetical protein